MPDDSNFVGTSQLSNVYRGHPDTTDPDDVRGQKSFGVGKKKPALLGSSHRLQWGAPSTSVVKCMENVGSADSSPASLAYPVEYPFKI